MITVRKKLALLISVPLLFQIGMSIAFGLMLHRSEQMAHYEYRSKEVIGGVNWLNFITSTLALCWIGHVSTGEPALKQSYLAMQILLPREIADVTSMFQTDKVQKSKADRLSNLFTRVAEVTAGLEKSESQANEKINALYKSNCLQNMWTDGATLRAELLSAERGKYKADGEDLSYVRNLERNVFYGGLAACILLTFSIVLYYGKTLGLRIDTLTGNAIRLSREEPLTPAIAGNDEIALLDDTFHKMAQALQEAAKKERAIVENAADAIIALDPDGKFLRLNQACESIMGYSREFLKGSNLKDYVAGDDFERFDNSLREVLGAEQARAFEFQFKRPDGTTADLLWSMRWVAQDNSIFCVAHDLTERKRVERLRMDLMAMVSHDIRTPITTILGCLDFMSLANADPDGSRRAKMLNVAQKCCHHVVTLTSDLLDLDKIDSGMLMIEKVDAELQKIFEDAEAAVSELAAEKRVNLVVSTSHLAIFADRNRIAQIIINLLGNAIKFSPVGASVFLSAAEVSSAVRISVLDQGRGVPKELLERIFERFRQVELSDSAVKRGTGLGLAICKALVEAHGGRIWCESEEGKGSAFHFEIPHV